MGYQITLSNSLAEEARIVAKALKRSIPKQIEHWAEIGKLAEENPDLSYIFIKDILIGKQEAGAGLLEPYNFG